MTGPPRPNDTDVRLFLLGSVMGALMHQRGRLPLHGSAIRLPDGTAAIFMGPSGVGKSTLAAAFRQRGYVVAADDISLIFTGDDGVPLLQPAYPELKLWAEAAAKIGEDAQTLPRARTQLEKYSLCFHHQFDATPLPLRRLYLLETTEDENFEIIRLQGMEKMAVLTAKYLSSVFSRWDGTETGALSVMRCLRAPNPDGQGEAAKEHLWLRSSRGPVGKRFRLTGEFL